MNLRFVTRHHPCLLLASSSSLFRCASALARRPAQVPLGRPAGRADRRGIHCPDPPPFSKSLDAEGYYTDAHHSVIDPVKKAAYEKAAEAPDHLGQWTTQAADAYLRHGSRAGAQCVYALLSAAAAAKAWSASMPTGQAHYVQKWLLAGTAMAYLKVRNYRRRHARAGQGNPEVVRPCSPTRFATMSTTR